MREKARRLTVLCNRETGPHPPLMCFADFRLTSWKVWWSLAITERLSPTSNHRKRVNYSGEEKVAIFRAHFVEGLPQEHVQLKKANGDP
jgi:hypothetical protein